jgi:hypothetical protein
MIVVCSVIIAFSDVMQINVEKPIAWQQPPALQVGISRIANHEIWGPT